MKITVLVLILLGAVMLCTGCEEPKYAKFHEGDRVYLIDCPEIHGTVLGYNSLEDGYHVRVIDRVSGNPRVNIYSESDLEFLKTTPERQEVKQ